MAARVVRPASVVALLVLASVLLVRAQSETVYVTRTGEKYHRGSCRYLSRSKIPMPLTDAVKLYEPCSVCRPPALGATPATPANVPPVESTAASPDSSLASTPVLITRTGAKYHRSGCRTLRAGGIPSTLGEASKRFGPCGVCRPPVLTSIPNTGSLAAPAARSTRCQAITRRGTQCSRNARPESRYCWQHGG